jgi:hypothetical protein
MRVVEQLDYARITCRICLLAAAISALPAVCGYAADLNQNLKLPTPFVVAQATPPKGAKAVPQASPVAPNASGAEIVGRLLSNPPSDPDVPLPQSNLATRPSADGPLDHPTIFGRQEEGGGVFGLKIPIPADRGLSDRHTRSSSGVPTGD